MYFWWFYRRKCLFPLKEKFSISQIVIFSVQFLYVRYIYIYYFQVVGLMKSRVYDPLKKLLADTSF